MIKASFGKHGDALTLKEFMNRAGSDDPKQWTVKPHCLECEEEVIPYDKRGARGFHAARDEATKPRRRPGFSHHKLKLGDTTSPSHNCPAALRDDPRFGGPGLTSLLEQNQFHAEEKDRNIEVLTEPRMKAALDEVQSYFMKRLTGSSTISDTDKKDIGRVTKGLITLAGLSQHPWLLPYMQVLYIGTRQRMSHAGRRLYKTVYDNKGTQRLPVTYADGQHGYVTVPREIILGFKRRHGITPMREQNGKKIISFPVSKAFAHGIVQEAHGRQKRAQARMEQARDLAQQSHRVLGAPVDHTRPRITPRTNPAQLGLLLPPRDRTSLQQELDRQGNAQSRLEQVQALVQRPREKPKSPALHSPVPPHKPSHTAPRTNPGQLGLFPSPRLR